MESEEFHFGFFLQLDVIIDFGGWEKVENVDRLCWTADTVDTTDTLHEPCRVPRGVIVDNNIGPMKIHSFGKDLGGDDNIEVVFLFSFIVSIKIG